MTELGFLLDLLLEHDELPKDIRLKIKDRIKEIEVKPEIRATPFSPYVNNIGPVPPHLAGQAPSTIKNFLKEEPTPTQASPVVTSPVVAQALQSRQAAIQESFSGKKGRTSPRKF